MANNGETVADAVNAIDELVATLHAKEREEGCDIKDVWSLVQQVKNRIEAAHKQEVGELKKRLIAIIEYARKSRWSSYTIHRRLHNICMKNIIDFAKGVNK